MGTLGSSKELLGIETTIVFGYCGLTKVSQYLPTILCHSGIHFKYLKSEELYSIPKSSEELQGTFGSSKEFWGFDITSVLL